jgi:hypothetical protein
MRDATENKTRPDLFSPLAMERIGEWLRLGSIKYGEHNYMKGIPISRCFQSLYRHLLKYQQNDRTEDNMAAVAVNAMMILHFEESIKRGLLPPSLLDMPKYRRPSSYYEGTPKIIAGKDGATIITVDDEPLYRAEDGEA